MEITVWKKFDPDYPRSRHGSGAWVHNHIEEGHVKGPADLKPVGDDNQTKSWAGYNWLHEHKELIDGKVV